MIDINRGEFSRVEFINFCIETLLHEEELKKEKERYAARREEVAPPKRVAEAEEEYVTRAEFEEFKEGIKELQKTFIDFFVTYGLELGGKQLSEEQERFKQEVKRLLEL
jgi:hypothetical protein